MVEILDLSRVQSFIHEPWKYAATPFREGTENFV